MSRASASYGTSYAASKNSAWDAIQIRRKWILILGMILLIPVYVFAPFVLVRFLCLFLLFILLGSRLYSEYLIRNTRVRRLDAELRVFRNEWVRVKLWAENHGALPAFMLVIGDTPGSISVFKNRKTLCTLLRHSRSLINWQGYCTERGVFTLGPVIVRGADPLGLFPFQLTAHETSRLFVYPAFRAIRLKAPGGIPLGNMIAFNPLFEDITRCRSLRPYYPGDEPRRINWKVSARMSHAGGTFMVNEYEATASYPLMIFLNLNQSEYPPKKEKMYMERVIEAATALCLQASREQQELGIIIFGSDQEGGISVIAPAAFTLVPILERLAVLHWTKPEYEPDTSVLSQEIKLSQESGPSQESRSSQELRISARAMLDQGKHLSYGTRFLYTGPDLGDEAYISLNSLKKHHLTLEYLIIDEQTVLPLVSGNSPRYQMQERGYEIIEQA